jgi:hypothetical protein
LGHHRGDFMDHSFKEKKGRFMLKALTLISVLFLWFSTTGQMCTKDIVYSKDYYTQPVSQYFDTDKATMMETVNRALEHDGYEIYNIDEAKGRYITGWKSVESDSHYLDFFGRRDYGLADSVYYQLVIDLLDEGSRVKVVASTTIKSIAGPMKSSGKVEKRIIAQLKDYLRAPQLIMTNVGVRKK